MKRKIKNHFIGKTRKLTFALATTLLFMLLLLTPVNGQARTTLPLNTSSTTEIQNTPTKEGTTTYNADIQRSDLPNSVDQQQAFSLMDSVVGFNLSSYTICFDGEKTNDYLGFSQNTVDCCLASPQGNMRAAFSFVNNRLHQIYISDWTGSVSLKHTANDELEASNNFLEQYQKFTGNTFYGTLRSMLSNLNVNENISKIVGNINLEVAVHGQSSKDFIWRFIDENGVIAQSKDVVLSYNNGKLQSFFDNWYLYKISGTVQVSKDDALTTALSAINSYEYNVSTNNGEIAVSGFKAHVVTDLALSYINEPNSRARDNDVFTLYPSWYVALGFDKVYPGGVTGAVVRVWGDNGQVSSINPMIFSAENEELNIKVHTIPVTASSILLPNSILAVLIAGIMISCFMFAKRFRKQKIEYWRTLPLCGIIVFSLMITAMPAVAAYPNSKAEVYASYWNQLNQEKTAMQSLTSNIQSYFDSVGYDTGRYCGTEDAATVYGNIEYDQQNFNRVAFFHYGHMDNPGNYWCSDDSYVTWDGVLSHTADYTDKHVFALVWVCNSADNDYWEPDVNVLARSFAA